MLANNKLKCVFSHKYLTACRNLVFSTSWGWSWLCLSVLSSFYGCFRVPFYCEIRLVLETIPTAMNCSSLHLVKHNKTSCKHVKTSPPSSYCSMFINQRYFLIFLTSFYQNIFKKKYFSTAFRSVSYIHPVQLNTSHVLWLHRNVIFLCKQASNWDCEEIRHTDEKHQH